MSVHLFLLIHIPAFFCIPQHPRRLSSDAGDAESGLFRQPGQVRLELSGQVTEDDPVLKFIRPREPVEVPGNSSSSRRNSRTSCSFMKEHRLTPRRMQRETSCPRSRSEDARTSLTALSEAAETNEANVLQAGSPLCIFRQKESSSSPRSGLPSSDVTEPDSLKCQLLRL